ncbi:type II secretion system protein [Desulforhopalus sp. IMCC35007]|uniref:type II secretion system protein n=1 Tax=Desulforhopalus sp. IMCC35007 TaxID=2569543 RepID=UPI00145D6F49|nr:prepilin-type N-terminal cleavage/methylation domain-containing protein [Desulforhopalus sp. IMCC35007]
MYNFSVTDTQNHQQRGFTLIELALVITIMGLLLSFGLVAWMSMKTSQQISAVKTTLTSVSDCLSNYVIHSGTIPPQAYFTRHCAVLDPWGNSIIYYNTGDNQEVSAVTTKTLRDETGDHPDTAWILASGGPDGTITISSTTTLWDCSGGDDLCRATSKSILIYEINK